MSVTLDLDVEEADNHALKVVRTEDGTESAAVACSCGWAGAKVYTDPGDVETLTALEVYDLPRHEQIFHVHESPFREWILHVYRQVAGAWGLPTGDGTRAEVALPAVEWVALLDVLAQADYAGIDDADRLRDLIRDYFG